MAISKPSWLRLWLDRLNWDIFTWKVYVGDAIESGIDWAIDWINYALDWGIDAWNKAVDAWNKAVEVGKELGKTIAYEIGKVWDAIDTWWDDLGDWWQEKKEWVKDRIDYARAKLEDLIDDVEKALNKLNAAWEDFKKTTLPKLIDFSWWSAFWGGMFGSIEEWWTPTRQALEDALSSVTDGIISEVNQITSKLAEWGEFFANPLEWLWQRFTDWFLGKE